MFTGIVQAVGKIRSQGESLLVESEDLPFSINIGDSVAVDGVCLTVASCRGNGFLADISEETLKRTTLGFKAEKNALVNLEPALRLSDRLGGHLVSGHVDGLGMVESLESLPNSWNLQINLQQNMYAKYICEKASIAVNGISLTVSQSLQDANSFAIAVIPHTWFNTSLNHLLVGDLVNLEVDLMAKYAERLLSKSELATRDNINNNYPNISKEWLSEQGWQ
ncbi:MULTISPECIES: riboflavin synthase [Prochlorococcus]|uniref:riboflavin synthase n=1 Tax=Prochlorococcus TaxID=1218 RepID=UPI000533B549|nr:MULTISPECIES: riboflavin synthase [Prochlorococcus]KGG12952.1 Riboflavin synthase eubacterial/eukaryotic [Prochlorococcus sp. MIT 0601]